MANDSTEYLLGSIMARLDNNDEDHKEIKSILSKLDTTLNICTLAFTKDITTLKTKASLWGAVAGFIASACIAIFVKVFVR